MESKEVVKTLEEELKEIDDLNLDDDKEESEEVIIPLENIDFDGYVEKKEEVKDDDYKDYHEEIRERFRVKIKEER